jgi:hypothetical protein
MVSELTRRVYMDNLLLRIPVIAGACLLDDLIYFGMHKLLGQPPAGDLMTTMAYSLIGTTIAGTLVYFVLQNMSGQIARRSKKREMFAPRRQTRRRNPIKLSK